MNKQSKAAVEKCKYCDGESIWYGVAPHKHDMTLTGSIIGSTVILPKEQWDNNFIEDPECEGCGNWFCKHCNPIPK